MAGPLPYMLLFVMVSQTISQSFPGNFCKNGGVKAKKDLQNLMPEMASCTKYHDIVQEIQTTPIEDAFDNICRRKDDLLKCTDKAVETIKPCMTEDLKPQLDILQRGLGVLADFLCKHKKDILTIATSQEEMKCLDELQTVSMECNLMNVESYVKQKTIDQQCRNVDAFLNCVENKFGRCKDSLVQQFLSDMVKEVVTEGICSKDFQNSGAASLLARVAFIPKPFNHVILGTIIPYILHY